MLGEGQAIGPYQLVRKLGEGTFGEVWLARHLDWDADFALKIPTDPQYIEQLRREGALLFGLSHPNIVDIQHSDTQHDPPYLAMEFVEGEDLRARLSREGRLPPDEALGILRQILAAVDAAHAQGVVHRDLKPANTLVAADGTVKVTDFGLGKVHAAVAREISLVDSLMTQEGKSISGTLAYMSPEQEAGQEPSPSDDVYALGILGCELLTGNRPSGAGAAKEMTRAGVPQEIVDVVERACDTRDYRYPTAGDMLAALSEARRAMRARPEDQGPADIVRAPPETIQGAIERLTARVERHSTDPRWIAYVPAVTGIIQQLTDALEMPPGPELEPTLQFWPQTARTFFPALEQLGAGGRGLVAEFEALAEQVEKGLAAGAWHWRPELPAWARAVDPHTGGGVVSLEGLVVLLEALDDTDLPWGEDEAVQEALVTRLSALQTAAERWIARGELPEGLAEAGVDPGGIRDEATAARWHAIEDFTAHWIRRVSGEETWPPGTLEASVAAIHAIRREIREAGLARHDALNALIRRLDHLLHVSATWARLVEQRDSVRDPRQDIVGYAEQTFSLCRFAELPDLIRRIEDLWSRLRGAKSVSDPRTLELLGETEVRCRSLLVRAGNPQLKVIYRPLAALVHNATEYGKLEEHRTRLLDLDDAFERALAPYARLDMDSILARLRQIADFFATWQPVSTADEDDEADAEPEDRADEEVQHEPPPPPRKLDAGDWELKEFLWNVGSVCRAFSGPSRDPVRRAIGVQLRAIHRWTASGARPGPEQLAATDAFFADPRIRRLVHDPARRDFDLQVVRTIDAYLQLWPAEDGLAEKPDNAYPPQILRPEHAGFLRQNALDDLEAWLGVRPDDRELIELHECLLRIRRGAAAREARRAVDVLSSARLEAADNPFPSVPDFVEALRAACHSLGAYVGGQRIASQAVFDQLLEQARAELRSVIGRAPWAERRALYAALDRQLRAMRRWSRRGRIPTPQERTLTHQALSEAIELEEDQTHADLVRQLRELDAAFQSWESIGPDPRTEEAERDEGITSQEQFLELLDEAAFETGELGYHFPAPDPTPRQEPAARIAHKLELMRTLCEAGKSSSTRDREEAASVLEDVAALSPDLCATIPDFKEDLRARIESLTAWFKELMRSPEFAVREVRPVSLKRIESLRIGAVTGARNAFVVPRGKQAGVYRCGCERVGAGESEAHGLRIHLSEFLPTSEGLKLLVPSAGRQITDLSWSLSYDFLAFRYPDENAVAWVQVGRISYLDGHTGRYDDRIGIPGEHGRTAALAYTWTSGANAMLVADPERGKLARLDVESGEQTDLVDVQHWGDLAPQILVSPDRSRVALTVGAEVGHATRVQIAEHRDRKPVLRTVKTVEEAGAHVLPFWINPGTLGLSILSPTRPRTTILSLAISGSSEKILYQSDLLAPPIAPAISPSGRYLAFYQRRASSPEDGPSDLILFDLDTQESRALIPSERILGPLRFAKESIFISGSTSALSIWLPDLHDRRLPPPTF